MALVDIVIDTNVLMHASNPNEARFTHSCALLTALLDTETALCVDEGFSGIESLNRSRIGSEYLRCLVPGELGSTFVTQLALNCRVVMCSDKIEAQDHRALNRLVVDKSDRVFARVAANCNDKVLVSHDVNAFPKHVNRKIRELLDVVILEAADAIGRTT